jgi:hypothetical protein
MAGRPVSLQGGQAGLVYGVVTFAIVSLAALGLFTFQLIKNKKIQNEWQSANTRIERFGSPPPYYNDEATSRKTKVFSVMADDLSATAKLVTGVPEDVGASIQAKAKATLADVESHLGPGTITPADPLLDTVATLSELCAKERGAAKTLTQQVQALRQDKDALTQQLQATRTDFESQVANLSTQLKLAQQEKMDAIQAKDQQLHDVQAMLDSSEGQLQTFKREGNSMVRDKDIEIGRLDMIVTELQKQIQALKPSGLDPTAILTKADGRILRAIPGSDVVYINLGAADRIRPGMGFEVFAPTGERTSGLRGKASLEVVTVMEETSECRIVRRGGTQPILEGDVLVNIAYERNRKPKFVVRGDFDLNYDGTVDYNGIEQVSAIIKQWGGQVVDDLDESVDFVVVGLPPTGPNIEGNDKATEVVRAEAQQKEFERSRFRALIERAQKMFIPVITQNQFLYLTGYAGDTTVARH